MIRSLLIFLLSLSFALPVFALEKIHKEKKGWTPWVSLGGATIFSDPAACTAGNFTYVFALNSARQISYRTRYLPTGNWSIWKNVPKMRRNNQNAFALGAPAVSCYQGPGYARVQIAVVGVDHLVWRILADLKLTGEDWFDWFVEPGFNADFYSGPAIATWNGGQTHIFARGVDKRIYVKIRTAPFQLLIPEETTGDPTAVWSSTDRLELFYRDKSGQIWHQFKLRNIWYPRQLIPPGETYGSPEVISRNSTTLDLFTTGPNNSLFYKRFANGVWSNWINMGGLIIFSPGATVYANSTRMMVFAMWKGDGTLRYRAWAP